MTIIYSGRLAITSILDNGTELVHDYIGKGTILNANAFLASRQSPVSVHCYTSVTFYYLPFEVLLKISQVYPSLAFALSGAQKKAQFDKMMDLNLLDYHEVDFNFEEKVQLAPHVELTADEKKRVPELRLILKNAVLHYLSQNRKKQGSNSLSSILQMAAIKEKKKKTLRTKMGQEIAMMGLVQRLDTLDANVGRISDDRFEKLKHRGNVVNRDALITMHRSVNLLKGLIERISCLALRKTMVPLRWISMTEVQQAIASETQELA